MEKEELRPFAHHHRWPLKEPTQDQGIIVAADISQEWLLTWWWENYIKYNTLPVSFVDFGMSPEGKAWCKERGSLIHLPIPNIFVTEKDFFPKKQIAEWEKEHGASVWNSRNAWFKKPLACLKSPYKKSLWLDLDCEIRSSIAPLFSLPLESGVSYIKNYYGEEDAINSGVIIFKYGAPLIQAWAENSFKQSHLFVGDENILNKLSASYATDNLPALYNWSRCHGDNPEAVIIHWHGNYGKVAIRHQITKKNLELSGFT